MEQHRPEVVPGARIFLTHLRREDVPLLATWFADLELNAYVGRVGGSSVSNRNSSGSTTSPLMPAT
jgi:hypothetical protein